MKRIQRKEALRSTIENAIIALSRFVYVGIQTNLEPIRVARASYALQFSGCSLTTGFPWRDVSQYLITNQHEDGGWNDVEETLWCIAYLRYFADTFGSAYENATRWLKSVQLPCGAWGKSSRDYPRITLTALASALAPDISSESSLKWLAYQWEIDYTNTTKLTYKGALYLLAHNDHKCADRELINKTSAYLVNEQEPDGGFGPWRGHPLGSDPWSTGIVIWGLSKLRNYAPVHTIYSAVSWLQRRQLHDGLWPYHYLDDGTAMALIGIVSALPVLRVN